MSEYGFVVCTQCDRVLLASFFFFSLPLSLPVNVYRTKHFLRDMIFVVVVRLVGTKNNWVLLHLPVEICRCICRDDFSFFPFELDGLVGIGSAFNACMRLCA